MKIQRKYKANVVGFYQNTSNYKADFVESHQNTNEIQTFLLDLMELQSEYT